MFFLINISDSRKKKKSGKNFKNKRSRQEVQVKKESYKKNKKKESDKNFKKKKESGKNSRTQESCLVRHFLPRQPRFCLQEYHQKVKTCFFRQESCIEGMAKESWLITKKNKNLERCEARSSTSDNTSLKWEKNLF